MSSKLILLAILMSGLFMLIFLSPNNNLDAYKTNEFSTKKYYWFVLYRKSEKEFLYFGKSGDVNNSQLVRTFQVKTGEKSSPTPLPGLIGKDYWLVVKKESSKDNPDTAPYFLRLNVPGSNEWPYGPSPYLECADELTGEKKQCNWGFKGYFGLHGINSDDEKLSKNNKGSNGCIRHSDNDITYLYHLLHPEKEEIRYYIIDV